MAIQSHTVRHVFVALDTPRKRWRCGSPRRCAARDDERGKDKPNLISHQNKLMQMPTGSLQIHA
ncbi:MAG: hypothetical protein Dbin4_01835 [Alphaproteobacteria bacterium]|nr:hypothetical protein [Alphaproteobacteria bacterium]